MKRYIVTEDQLQCLAIDNRNYARARLDGQNINEKTLFDNLQRSEANCRAVEVPEGAAKFYCCKKDSTGKIVKQWYEEIPERGEQ